jgi:hypothetical protein
VLRCPVEIKQVLILLFLFIVNLNNHKSFTSPSFCATIAVHKSSHRLICSSYLFHLLAIRGLFMAESALFMGIFVDIFLHFIIKSRFLLPCNLQKLFLQPPFPFLSQKCIFGHFSNSLGTFFPFNHFQLCLNGRGLVKFAIYFIQPVKQVL